MVSLKVLETALNQVEKIRDHVLTFNAGGTRVSLRALRSEEETEVQRYAQVAFEGTGDEPDQAHMADFMDRLRHGSLGFSVVRLGDLDLQDVSYIETGEMDERTGKPVSVPKWEAVRDLIAKDWSRAMLAQVFAKFGELLDRVDLYATERVKLDPVDAKEERERLERRLEELREAEANAKKTVAKDPVQKQQKAIADVDKTIVAQREDLRRRGSKEPVQDPPQEAVEGTLEAPSSPVAEPASPPSPPQAAAPVQAPQEPQAPQQGRRSASVPESAVAPPERPVEQRPQETQEMPTDQREIPLPHEGDTFFDPADPEAAVAAETQRQIMLQRQQAAREQKRQEMLKRRAEMEMPTSAEQARQRMTAEQADQRPTGAVTLDPRTQGLREAANLNDATFDAGAGSVRSGRPVRTEPQPVAAGGGTPAKLHGKPVYKRPAETLERPQNPRHRGAPEPEAPAQINPGVGGHNPNFRGPQDQ